MSREYKEYRFSKGEKARFTVGFLLLLGIGSYLFYRNCILILLFPVFYRTGEKLYRAYHVNKQKTQLLQEFRDFLYSLSTSFSTGRHLREGIFEAGDYLMDIYGQEGLMAGEVAYMKKAIEEAGQSEKDVFSDFAVRSDLEDIRTFSEVYAACRETGGDMVSAVNKAARLLSEKIQLEMEIKTLLSQKRFEGRMIASMPFVMIIFLLIMSPDYLQVLYDTPAGRCVMTAALVLNVFAYIWMERMTNVEV